MINFLAYVLAVEYFLDGPSKFAEPWGAAVAATTHPSFTPTNFIAVQQILGFLTGLLAIWIYGKMHHRRKSRFPWIAVLIAWLASTAAACAFLLVEKIPLSALAVIAGLVETWMGTALGSWIYREAESAVEVAAAQPALEGEAK